MTTIYVELREVAVAAIRGARPLTDGELRRIGVPPKHALAMAEESRGMTSVDDALRLAEEWTQVLQDGARPIRPARDEMENSTWR